MGSTNRVKTLSYQKTHKTQHNRLRDNNKRERIEKDSCKSNRA